MKFSCAPRESWRLGVFGWHRAALASHRRGRHTFLKGSLQWHFTENFPEFFSHKFMGQRFINATLSLRGLPARFRPWKRSAAWLHGVNRFHVTTCIPLVSRYSFLCDPYTSFEWPNSKSHPSGDDYDFLCFSLLSMLLFIRFRFSAFVPSITWRHNNLSEMLLHWKSDSLRRHFAFIIRRCAPRNSILIKHLIHPRVAPPKAEPIKMSVDHRRCLAARSHF